MLRPLDVSAPAVRTAISRMVRQGWLHPVRLDQGRGYALTERATHRLDEAAVRIYRTRQAAWDGSWDLLVLDPVPHRSARDRLRSGLSFLGYGALSDSTWIGPVHSPEVDTLLENEHATATRFAARDDDPRRRAERAWDLTALAVAYERWHKLAQGLVTDPARSLPDTGIESADEEAFAIRSHLVHEWRKFLFTDPGLPAELLPADWPGNAAARFFAEEAARLLPPASRFVDQCLLLTEESR
jgi:phenylacetic acid degradation operon negative regulatory protein